MSRKGELVLTPYIWWHFIVHKINFAPFSFNPFPKCLFRPCNMSGTLLGAWETSMNKIGRDAIELVELTSRGCTWSLEPMDIPANPLGLYSWLCQHLDLKCICHLPLVTEWSLPSRPLSSRHSGSWTPTGDGELVATCFAWVPSQEK